MNSARIQIGNLLARSIVRGMEKRFQIARLAEIDPTPCPCGQARRAFVSPDNPVASIHLVEIAEEAETHYHKEHTEIYLILETEGDCFLELDGERHDVQPLTTVLIKPGCRHRAVGKMKIINLPVPTFDPADEWFD